MKVQSYEEVLNNQSVVLYTPLPRRDFCEQVECIAEECYNPWVDHSFFDSIAGSPSHVRGVVVLSCASGDPTIASTSGCTAHLLHAWDTSVPVSFGGDIHNWWRAYYMVLTGPVGTWSATVTGGLPIAAYSSWFFSRDPLPTGGTYGDGVDVTFIENTKTDVSAQLIYNTDVSTSTKHGNAVTVFTDIYNRSIDDFSDDYVFKQDSPGTFDMSNSTFNVPPQPNLYMLSDPLIGAGHGITIKNKNTVIPLTLPNSARATITQLSVVLNAHCP